MCARVGGQGGHARARRQFGDGVEQVAGQGHALVLGKGQGAHGQGRIARQARRLGHLEPAVTHAEVIVVGACDGRQGLWRQARLTRAPSVAQHVARGAVEHSHHGLSRCDGGGAWGVVWARDPDAGRNLELVGEGQAIGGATGRQVQAGTKA